MIYIWAAGATITADLNTDSADRTNIYICLQF